MELRLFHLALENKIKWTVNTICQFFFTNCLLNERALKLYHSSALLYTEVPYGGTNTMSKGRHVAN